MPRLSMEHPHALGQDEAIQRIKAKIEKDKEAYAGKFNNANDVWEGNTLNFGFEAVGMTVSGTMTVEESAVKIDAKLPLAAMMFKGIVEQKTHEELEKLLA